jgi:hypothetical protein
MRARIVAVDVFQNKISAAWADWSTPELNAFRDGIGGILTSPDVKLVTDEGKEVFMASKRVHSITLELSKS